MYLTQMKLNPSREGTRRAMASDQVMHAMVQSSFPHLNEGDRVLWRTDVMARHDISLYVVSSTRPDMTGIVEQAGWPLEQTWRTASYAPVLDHLEAGQTWRFRLSANPTMTKSRGQGHRGKVIPLTTFARQTEWLTGKARAIGVDFGDAAAPSFQVVKKHLSDFARRDPTKSESGRVRLTKVVFEGALEVVDPVLLRSALVNGIGRGKAYGCGLLTLATA